MRQKIRILDRDKREEHCCDGQAKPQPPRLALLAGRNPGDAGKRDEGERKREPDVVYPPPAVEGGAARDDEVDAIALRYNNMEGEVTEEEDEERQLAEQHPCGLVRFPARKVTEAR